MDTEINFNLYDVDAKKFVYTLKNPGSKSKKGYYKKDLVKIAKSLGICNTSDWEKSKKKVIIDKLVEFMRKEPVHDQEHKHAVVEVPDKKEVKQPTVHTHIPAPCDLESNIKLFVNNVHLEKNLKYPQEMLDNTELVEDLEWLIAVVASIEECFMKADDGVSFKYKEYKSISFEEFEKIMRGRWSPLLEFVVKLILVNLEYVSGKITTGSDNPVDMKLEDSLATYFLNLITLFFRKYGAEDGEIKGDVDDFEDELVNLWDSRSLGSTPFAAIFEVLINCIPDDIDNLQSLKDIPMPNELKSKKPLFDPVPYKPLVGDPHCDTPVESPCDTPCDTPCVSPVGSPVGSPCVSPVGSPVGSPCVSPVGSPVGSPCVSPVGSPCVSPVGSPCVSPIVGEPLNGDKFVSNLGKIIYDRRDSILQHRDINHGNNDISIHEIENLVNNFIDEANMLT